MRSHARAVRRRHEHDCMSSETTHGQVWRRRPGNVHRVTPEREGRRKRLTHKDGRDMFEAATVRGEEARRSGIDW